MRTCFIHIGMHKTGSTAIQSAFHGYDDGKTVVLRLGKPNHTWPLLMIFSARRDWAAKKSGARISNLDDHIRDLRERIVSQFQANQSNFVITGEGLSANLTVTEIAEFKAFLSAWFDEIKIIIYFRDPISYMRSMFQETSKKSAIAFDLDLVQPSYRKRTVSWIEVFGRTKVDVVLYDRKAFTEGSVIHDFASRIDADILCLGPQTGNATLKAEGFALTYAIRDKLAFGKPSGVQRVRLLADLNLTPRYGKLNFDFSDAIFLNALAKQKDDIAWAEDLLQQPFPSSKPAVDAIIFGSHNDVLRYAQESRSGFDRWKRESFSLGRRLRYLVRALRGRVK